MLDKSCSFQNAEVDFATSWPPPSRYDFTLAEAIRELGILVGPGSLDAPDVPPVTSTTYDPKRAIFATASLEQNQKVVPASQLQQVLSKETAQSSRTPLRTQPVAQSSAVDSPSCSRAATAGDYPPRGRPASASTPPAQHLPHTAVRSKSASTTSIPRPRASTGTLMQPAAGAQLALTRLPTSQASNQLNNALVSRAPHTALAMRSAVGSQQRKPSNELSRYVEASIEYGDPLQPDIAISGNFTPGGFGLRVRSQSHRVQHDGRTGRTSGMYSINILQQDTNGNALISGDRSDIQGSWTQVRQAIQGLQNKQSHAAW